MINISDNSIVEKIKGTGRTFRAKLVEIERVKSNGKYIDIDTGVVYTEISSLKQVCPLCSNNLSIGQTPSSYIEATIRDCKSSLYGKEFKVILSIDDYVIPLGFFTVSSVDTSDGGETTKITAYDRMLKMESKKLIHQIVPKNDRSVFEDLCSILGYEADVSTIPDGWNMGKRYSEGANISYREVLGHIAAFYGKNCVVGADGIFRMVDFKAVNPDICKVDIDSLESLDFPSTSVSVDYIYCTVDENTSYDYGTGSHGLNTYIPYLDSEQIKYTDETKQYTPVGQLEYILSQISNGVKTNYYPAKFKQLNGDPRIEVGDVIKVGHKDIGGTIKYDYVPVMSLTREFDGGLTVSIESYEPTDEFYSSISDQTKALIEASKVSTERSEALAELNKAISNGLGLYIYEEKDDNGATKYYFHNKENITSSTYIFTINDSGFAYVKGENCWNDGNPNWKGGMDSDGNSILNTLSVLGINADWIKAGVISSTDGKTYFDLANANIHTESKDESDENTYYIGDIQNGIAEFGKYLKGTDENGNDTFTTLSKTFVGEAGVFVTGDIPDNITIVYPPNWSDMQLGDKLVWLATAIAEAITKSQYGINIISKKNRETENEESFFCHLDGEKLEFGNLLGFLNSGEETTYSMHGAKAPDFTISKFDGTNDLSVKEVLIAMENYVTPRDFRNEVTFESGEEGTSNCIFMCTGSRVDINYQGSQKAHSSNDVLFTLPSSLFPPHQVHVCMVKNASAYGTVVIGTDGKAKVNFISNTTTQTRIYFQATYYINY